MKEKRRGFTLIELLSVIVILAIISLIATPIVLNIINSARKGAVVRSAEGVLKASKLYYIQSQLNPTNNEDGISFNCDKKGCISTKTDESGELIKLDLDGVVGEGYVNISKEGKVSFKLSKDGYCTYKYVGENKIKIKKGNCDNVTIVDDSIPPVIRLNGNVITTSDSIIIGYTIEEKESGLKPIECTYGIEEGKYNRNDNVVASETGCSISNLTIGKYYYKVCATDQGMNTSCIEGEATTSEIPTPKIEFKDATGKEIKATENGYVEKDYITVTYNNNNLEGATNYIKTTVEVVPNIKGKLENCGNEDIIKEECVEEEGNIKANTWYKIVGTTSITVEFKEEGELVAVTNDKAGNTNANNTVSRHIIPIINQIEFDNTNVNSSCSELKCAIDELYGKIGN